jgi:5-formyltetrahydrofolate cyclo-ligase
MIQNSSLRKHLRQRRSSLSPAVQQAASQKIAAKIFTTPKFQQSKNIACYLAFKGEIDLAAVIQRIWQDGKNCYLPLITSLPPIPAIPTASQQHTQTLSFVAYHEDDRLVMNKLGILEPTAPHTQTTAKVIAAEDLDLVIVPLVAFDSACNRLGQGGGFYDRAFAFRAQMGKQEDGARGNARNINKPFLLGVAYEWQRQPQLHPAPWDVKLDMIITEENIFVAGD